MGKHHCTNTHVRSFCPYKRGLHLFAVVKWHVVDDWDCMLNQTNIGQNNNKYYIIQLLQQHVVCVCVYAAFTMA